MAILGSIELSPFVFNMTLPISLSIFVNILRKEENDCCFAIRPLAGHGLPPPPPPNFVDHIFLKAKSKNRRISSIEDLFHPLGR